MAGVGSWSPLVEVFDAPAGVLVGSWCPAASPEDEDEDLMGLSRNPTRDWTYPIALASHGPIIAAAVQEPAVGCDGTVARASVLVTFRDARAPGSPPPRRVQLDWPRIEGEKIQPPDSHQPALIGMDDSTLWLCQPGSSYIHVWDIRKLIGPPGRSSARELEGLVGMCASTLAPYVASVQCNSMPSVGCFAFKYGVLVAAGCCGSETACHVVACGADKWLGVPSADDGEKEKKKPKDHLRKKANNKFRQR